MNDYDVDSRIVITGRFLLHDNYTISDSRQTCISQVPMTLGCSIQWIGLVDHWLMGSLRENFLESCSALDAIFSRRTVRNHSWEYS